MNIVEDGKERYIESNRGKIRKMRRLVIIEVNQKYEDAIRESNSVRRVYLRCKRWLELRQKLNQLQQDLDRNLYWQVTDH